MSKYKSFILSLLFYISLMFFGTASFSAQESILNPRTQKCSDLVAHFDEHANSTKKEDLLINSTWLDGLENYPVNLSKFLNKYKNIVSPYNFDNIFSFQDNDVQFKNLILKHQDANSVTNTGNIQVFKSEAMKSEPEEFYLRELEYIDKLREKILLNENQVKSLFVNKGIPVANVRMFFLLIVDYLNKELKERFVQYLLSTDIKMKILNHPRKSIKNDVIYGVEILPEGEHIWNQRAKQLFEQYDKLRIQWVTDMEKEANGAYNQVQHIVYLNYSNIYKKRVKGETLRHELAHCRNCFDDSRNFGVSVSFEKTLLPFIFTRPGYGGYEQSLSFDENETFSKCLHFRINEILELLRTTDYDFEQHLNALRGLFRLIETKYVIAERSRYISRILKEKLSANKAKIFWQPLQQLIKEKWRPEYVHFPIEETVAIPLYHTGLFSGPFIHFFVIQGLQNMKTETEIRSHLENKIQRMEELSRNYRAQARVQMAVALKLMSVDFNRYNHEQILKGLRAISRPFFWDAIESPRENIWSEEVIISKFNLSVEKSLIFSQRD